MHELGEAYRLEVPILAPNVAIAASFFTAYPSPIQIILTFLYNCIIRVRKGCLKDKEDGLARCPCPWCP